MDAKMVDFGIDFGPFWDPLWVDFRSRRLLASRGPETSARRSALPTAAAEVVDAKITADGGGKKKKKKKSKKKKN